MYLGVHQPCWGKQVHQEKSLSLCAGALMKDLKNCIKSKNGLKAKGFTSISWSHVFHAVACEGLKCVCAR